MMASRWGWWIVVALALEACSSSTTDVDGSSEGDATVAQDSGDKQDATTEDKTAPTEDGAARDASASDGGDEDCPTTAPNAGGACSNEGLRCTFGTSPACGDIWECVDRGWKVIFDGADCSGTSLPTCPEQEPAGLCNPSEVGGGCRYGLKVCRCELICSGVQPPPGKEHGWVCAFPQPGACPAKVPAEGSPCKADGLQCVYGYCGGQTAVCGGGQWRVTTIPPPP